MIHVKIEYSDDRDPIVVDINDSRFRDDEYEEDLENALEELGYLDDPDVLGWDVLTQSDYQDYNREYDDEDLDDFERGDDY